MKNRYENKKILMECLHGRVHEPFGHIADRMLGR